MDIATIAGLIAGVGVICGAIFMSGGFAMFVDIPSIVIVLGGTFASTLMKFPLGHVIGSVKVALKAFLYKAENPRDLIDIAVELAGVVRKEGMLGLEGKPMENVFFQRGLLFCIEGQKAEFIRQVLTQDMDLTIERHDVGRKIFAAVGDTAPAMGMIGTLIGLVAMLANLNDPSAIGPAMAVALLTTLYGALIANLFAIPIAAKLGIRSNEERLNKALIVETFLGLQSGQSPRALEEALLSYLPQSKRQEEEVVETGSE